MMWWLEWWRWWLSLLDEQPQPETARKYPAWVKFDRDIAQALCERERPL